MSSSSLTLRSGSLELVIEPEIGGSIASFTWTADSGRSPILRSAPGPLEKVLDSASFPLIPFANRIRGGAFQFRGRKIQLTANMPGDRNPLHGQGWLSPWRVETAGEEEALLLFDHEPGEWPWAYQGRQRLWLTGDSLCLQLGCRNLSDEPMPCGLGIHPYFNCGPGTRIQTSVDEVWTVDEHVLPVDRLPPAGRYDISDSLVCGRSLDNGYGGWSGQTLLTDPDWPFEIVLSSRQARFFQLYSPAEGGIFVAEPVSHANAALNEPDEAWPYLGIRVLMPGEEMVLDSRIEVQPK